MLTIYDSDGNYGHPDHIQVHRVGVRAAELAGTARVFEGTINRDHIKRAMLAAAEAGELPGDDAPDPDDFETFGRPESMITTTVDVRDFIEQKRASMAAHASQIARVVVLPRHAARAVRGRVRPGVVHPPRRARGPPRRRPLRRPR